MKETYTTPNKKIMTSILLFILLLYIGIIPYVAITKEDNNLAGNRREKVYEDKYYDDMYYYDPYEETQEYNLDINSETVKKLYSYIKLYPYTTNIKGNFNVSELTKEQKMRLVASSLKSKNISQSSPTIKIETTEIYNSARRKRYYITNPVVQYESYKVSSIYKNLFGLYDNIDYSITMYDGEYVMYYYNELSNSYIKYEANDKPTSNYQEPKLVKAVQNANTVEIYLEIGTRTEKYLFNESNNYNYKYQFIGREIEYEKNSL